MKASRAEIDVTTGSGGLSQKFSFSGKYVVRWLDFGGLSTETKVERVGQGASSRVEFYRSWLANRPKYPEPTNGRINYIDLFCGGGGLSLGVHNSLRQMGFAPRLVAAADLDGAALSLVKSHFSPIVSRNKYVEELLTYMVDYSGSDKQFTSMPSVLDAQIAQYKGKIDLLVGGPPCQGHSNLNNRTRRRDPRNLLYFVMPATAVALNVPNVIIENVPSIAQAQENVVELTRGLLETNGYHVRDVILNASDFSVAQGRTRHFLVASSTSAPIVSQFAEALKGPPLSFSDVATNLPALAYDYPTLEMNGVLSEENVTRINYLHDHDLYDLPNAIRPECHREEHTYPSVYGRIYPDQPALTITTGFGSPGRGRYVHPYERRVINIREAGRLQSFPDWYWESAKSLNFTRKDFQKVIGDAVPSLMVEPLAFSLFEGLKAARSA